MKRTVILRTGTVAACAALVLSPVVMVEGVDPGFAAEPPLAPIAISGTIDGVRSLMEDSVKVQIAPDQQAVAALDGTASVQNSEVPAAMVEASGSHYTVRIDPAAVPAQDISGTGIVNFVIYAQDPRGARFSVGGGSARAVVTGDGSYAWVDPDAPTTDLIDHNSLTRRPILQRGDSVTKYASVVRPVRIALSKPTARGVICDSAGCATTSKPSVRRIHVAGRTAPVSARALDDGETEAGAIDAPVISELPRASSCPVGGRGDVYSTKRSVSTTIGTAYPVGGDKAWMRHTAGSATEFGTALGIATDIGGAFHQSSTRSVERSVGFTWDGQTYARSFRVGVIYQKVLAMFDRCSGGPYYTTWVPIGYNGGFGENTSGVTRPNWTHCVEIGATGRWDRKSSSGSAYSSSAGLKFASVIGIDLSSKRNYNAESVLSYQISVKGRRVCGSNAFPQQAAKVMERLKKR